MDPTILAQIPYNIWFLILLLAAAVAAVVFTLVFVFIVDRKYGRPPAEGAGEGPRAGGDEPGGDARE